MWRTPSNTFKYDPFGRRIEKISPTTTSIFAYDGDNLIETVNSTGGLVAHYTQGEGIDEPLAMQRGATTDYYEADGLGSITSLTGSNGSVAQSYTYDSFGNQAASSGSLTNFLRYTAREFDTETNLYYYRARYYDPTSGRFLSEDPVKFRGGVDFFEYVDNNPVNLIDPIGLWPQGPFIGPITCLWCDEFGAGANDMWNNYRRMEKRKWINGDKYYHCMANCQATDEGPGGNAAAVIISWFRTDFFSHYIHKEPDWRDDKRANTCGQQGGDCKKLCDPFAPKYSPGKPPFQY